MILTVLDFPSRFCLVLRKCTLSRPLNTLRCIGGRLPLTEQRVKADTCKYHFNNYLCDFMSHP
ncbi:hypothetical protein, partial [Phocaeicola dorei]|uniref:hypothetical protein n=1 Tax=Phocaeicola dorei TaxID=357276 RepID=UPI001F1FDBD1